MRNIKYSPTEEISLPVKYQTPITKLSLPRICVLYQDLLKDHLLLLQHLEEVSRGSWANERLIETQCDLIMALQITNNKFKRLNEYIGPRPPISTVDDTDSEE